MDFEARSIVDLPKHGVQRYAYDASTQALCLAWQYDEQPIDGEVHLWHRGHDWIEKSERPDELIERIRDGEPIEAHNAGMEFYMWNLALRREFPEFDVEIKLEQLHCSAAKASCLSLPRSLGDAVKALNLPHKKQEIGKTLINKLSKPMAKRKGFTGVRWNEDERLHRLNWEYCKDDVRAERGLSEYCPEMSPRERKFWMMDFRMNERGIYLDREAAEVGIKLATQEADRLNEELQEITGGMVEGFSKRIPLKEWLNASLSEIGQPIVPDTKADTFSFRLIGVPTKAGDEAKEVGKIRMDAEWDALGERAAPIKRAMEIAMEGNRSSVAKYKRMVQGVCPDDRLHDIMLYNGADRTGRWSGKGVQPHNFVRGYGGGYKALSPRGFDEMQDVWEDLKHLDLDVIQLIWGDPMVVLAKACRGALTATPGKVLYAADFAAIEARKLAWLSGCSRMLDAFNTPGKDIYCDMATAIYKREITKKDKDERQLGKKAILGLGYAMGWEKFQSTVWNDEGIWLEDELCKMIVTLYRKQMYPEVPALWKAAEVAACNAVRFGGEWSCGGNEIGIGSVSYFMDRDFLHCRLPSGRLLAYLYPEVHTRLNYRFKAKNARGSSTIITFPVKRKDVSMFRVRRHAEELAKKQNKILLSDAPETFEQPHLSFMGRDTYTRRWKRCGTHGGTLVENFDQASSRDLLAESMLRIDQMDDLDVLLSIHDEVVAEGAKGACTLGEFETEMATVPEWAPGMPIKAEGWIGERLRK
jgi:DNA polymerase